MPELPNNGSVTYIVRILIAGCGQVGTALGQALVSHGHQVWGVRRAIDGLPPEIQGISADLTVAATLEALPEVDALVYAAAAASGSPEAYEAAYVRGLENVLRASALRASPPKRALFTSTTAVYAQQHGEWVDEHSETQPSHFSGQIHLRAEALLQAESACGIALRCGGIYGPGRNRLLQRVSRGQAVYPPGPPVYSNRVHIDDVAGALEHLLVNVEQPEPVYNCVDDAPVELRTVLAYLARELQAPPPREQTEEPVGRARRTNKRCSNRRLRSSGYDLRYPTFKEGYASMLPGLN